MLLELEVELLTSIVSFQTVVELSPCIFSGIMSSQTALHDCIACIHATCYPCIIILERLQHHDNRAVLLNAVSYTVVCA